MPVNESMDNRRDWVSSIIHDESSSFQKNTEFKTRIQKPYPIWEQNGQLETRYYVAEQLKQRSRFMLYVEYPLHRNTMQVLTNFNIHQLSAFREIRLWQCCVLTV